MADSPLLAYPAFPKSMTPRHLAQLVRPTPDSRSPTIRAEPVHDTISRCESTLGLHRGASWPSYSAFGPHGAHCEWSRALLCVDRPNVRLAMA